MAWPRALNKLAADFPHLLMVFAVANVNLTMMMLLLEELADF